MYLAGMWDKCMFDSPSPCQPVLTISVRLFGMGPSIRREAEALIDSAEPCCRTTLFLN